MGFTNKHLFTNFQTNLKWYMFAYLFLKYLNLVMRNLLNNQ